MLVLKGLVGLHRTIQFQLLQHTGRGIGLDYCDIEWFGLESNRDLAVIFLRLYTSTAFRILLLSMMATPFLLMDSYPQ